MRFRCLGCDGGIGGEFRTTSFLVDDDVLIDAGTGVGDLAAAELEQITDVILTHAHVDHTVCLPLLIDATVAGRRKPLVVRGTAETLDALGRHVFNNEIWPDFTRIPTPEQPFLRYVPLSLGESLELGNRRITALPVEHTVPAVGFRLDSGRASLVFSGDTDRGRDAGCPAPPAQIRTGPLGHPAPPLGRAHASADGESLIRPRVSDFQLGPVSRC